MMFRFLRDEGDESLDRIETIVQEMFVRDRREFDLAMSALLGDATVADVNPELRSSDQRVNELERAIRRELTVHASVYGGIDTPAVLTYMSIVKDVERLGDYAKNLLDLARDGANLAGIPDEAEWRQLTADIGAHMTAGAEAFGGRDAQRARTVADAAVALMVTFDRRVAALVRGDDTGPQPVARALAYRYLKRIVAHLANVLTAVIMPVDRLDYLDEKA
jgi:phosphate uptake regulator